MRLEKGKEEKKWSISRKDGARGISRNRAPSLPPQGGTSLSSSIFSFSFFLAKTVHSVKGSNDYRDFLFFFF